MPPRFLFASGESCDDLKGCDRSGVRAHTASVPKTFTMARKRMSMTDWPSWANEHEAAPQKM